MQQVFNVFSLKVSDSFSKDLLFPDFFRLNPLRTGWHPLENKGAEGKKKNKTQNYSSLAITRHLTKSTASNSHSLETFFAWPVRTLPLVHLLLQRFVSPVWGRPETATVELTTIPSQAFWNPPASQDAPHLCSAGARVFISVVSAVN